MYTRYKVLRIDFEVYKSKRLLHDDTYGTIIEERSGRLSALHQVLRTDILFIDYTVCAGSSGGILGGMNNTIQTVAV